MRELNKWNCLTYHDAALTLGISLWRLRYAVESGYLPPPSVILKRRALFSPEQIESMRQYFEQENTHRQGKANPSGQERWSRCKPPTDA